MSSSAFSPTLTVTGGTSQQGEINIITNPVAQSNTSDWTTSSVTLSRVATGSPLDPEIPTGFQAVSTTTTTSYVQTALQNVAPSLRNRKLKVQFFLALTDSTSWKVDVFKSDGVTRYPLSTDSSAVTVIPALTGTFTTTFDMDTGTGIYVRFTRYAGAGTSTLNFTNLIVGPGIQPQGAAVQEWLSYTPTVANLGAGSTTTNVAYYSRIGSTIHIKFTFTKDASAGTGATTVTVTLPSNLTIDFTKISTDEQSYAGSYDFRNGSAPNTNNPGSIKVTSGSTNSFYFQKSGATVAALTGADFPGTARIEGFVTLPIAEWSGSGTVQLAQNDVEYVWNSDPGVAAGTTYSNSVYYGYGPSGTPFLAYNSATASGFNTTKYRVQFQTPIQATDAIQLEVLPPSSSTWLPSEKALVGYFIGNTAIYGARLVQISSTQVNVEFGNAGQSMGGIVTVGNAGDPWSSLATNGWRWRVRKTSAGAAVGFGIVVPGTSAGLVSASGVPGNTTGNTIASGFVGERKVATSTTAVTTGGVQVNLLSLDPGVWLVNAITQIQADTAAREVYTVISTTSNTVPAFSTDGAKAYGHYSTANGIGFVQVHSFYVNLAATTVYYQNSQATSVSGLTATNNRFQAIRIA